MRVQARVVGQPGIVTATVTPAPVARKGIQIEFSRRPSVGQLINANVGAARIFTHGYTADLWANTNAYAGILRSAGIEVIICDAMVSGLGYTAWTDRVHAWVSAIPNASLFELGNEKASGFAYAGVPNTNWNGYFTAIEDAVPVVHEAGGVPIMGAALDNQEVARLDFARARWGNDWPTPVGVAVHPYGQCKPWTRQGAIGKSISRIAQARVRVPQTIPLYATECGWGTAGNCESTLVVLTDCGDPAPPTVAEREAEHAALITAFHNQLRPRVVRTDLNLAYWGYTFFWRDSPNPTSWWQHCGLLREDATVKPALAAYSAEPAWRTR